MPIDKHSSEASDNFRYAIQDVDRLIELYDQISRGKLTTAARRSSALKRAAVILSVTTWETYIEDIIRERFELRLKDQTSPEDFRSALCLGAQVWLNGNPAPPDILKWTGDAWKETVRWQLSQDLQKLNTPNTQNIRKLTKHYLGDDLTAHWKWRGVSPSSAQQRLDELIKLRGEFAHRARDVYSLRALIRKEKATRALSLVRKLVDATDNYFGISIIWIRPGLVR